MTQRPSLTAGVAGGAYFLCVFATGFVLGVIRALLVMPYLGSTVAVLLELPIILGIAWIVCRKLTALLDLPDLARERIIMGGVAFALLMLAEFGVSALVFGRGPLQHLHDLTRPWALFGLAGQLAFAAFPLLQLDRRSTGAGGSH